MAVIIYLNSQYGELTKGQQDANTSNLKAAVETLQANQPNHNYSATTDPTVNDDVTQGYSTGSKWYNKSTPQIFICTNASSGAANWVADPIVTDDLGTAAFAELIGTVSQSGGTPTGAVMEYGSNANGEYLKLADGSMFCRAIVTASTGGAVSWTFPVSFATTDDLDVKCQPLSSAARIGAVSINSVNSMAFSSWSTGDVRQATDCSLSAHGRWFV